MTDPLREGLEELVRRAREEGREKELESLLFDFGRELQRASYEEVEGEVPQRFGMVGQSAPMLKVFDLIERAAQSQVPILIQGETGTGKELVARAIHDVSPRRQGPFVAENCAAVPATLLESELFGHTRGAFTGAVADRKGRFVSADGGTLFLDEIGDMPLEMQAKLLRVLEEGEVRPVGATKTQKVDVRIVVATHRDLVRAVAAKEFREDLFYRLNVVRIELPALRERPGDIELLARHFAVVLARSLGKPPVELTDEALAVLTAAPWPGNVRQLENELRRAIALGQGRLSIADLSPSLAAPG